MHYCCSLLQDDLQFLGLDLMSPGQHLDLLKHMLLTSEALQVMMADHNIGLCGAGSAVLFKAGVCAYDSGKSAATMVSSYVCH